MSQFFEPITPAQIIWRDGLPYSQQFNDIYFSTAHGLEESHYVFIEGNHLIERFKQLQPSDRFVIGECGFGTGLNILLAVKYFKQYAPKKAQLYIFSAEKHPLTPDDLKKSLALWPQLSVEAEILSSVYPKILTPGCHCCVLEENRIYLNLMLGDAVEMLDSLLISGHPIFEPQWRKWHMDAWFLDGFAPSKNPDLWSKALFSNVALLSASKTTFATFSAAGNVRRGLMAAGFEVKKQRGFGVKREMLVGQFLDDRPKDLDSRHVGFFQRKGYTPWHVSLTPQVRHPECNEGSQDVIVLGAGLAGCFISHALAERGCKVTLIDQASSFAQGASANPQAVLYPNFSAFKSPLTLLMLQAFVDAIQQYTPWIEGGLIEGELNGILQLAYDQKTQQYFSSLRQWLSDYPALGQLVSSAEASQLADMPISHSGLFIPQAGWINLPSLCEYLLQSVHIHPVFDYSVQDITYSKNRWQAGEYTAPTLVLAMGFNTTTFSQTKQLSLIPFKGQMTAIKETPETRQLKIPLCAKGHLLPSKQGQHWAGATYHQGLMDVLCDKQDDKENMHMLKSISLDLKNLQVNHHWAGIRAATRDYLPLVGPVPNFEAYAQIYAPLASNARRFVPQLAPSLPGLFLCTGFGSRGLTTIPFCSTYLADCIAGRPTGLSRIVAQSLSPARFLIKKMVKGGR